MESSIIGGAVLVTILVTVGSLLLVALIFGIIFWFLIRPMLKNRKILKHGIPAEGKILNIQDTGVQVNHQPQALITLEVESRQFGVYRAQARQVVNHFTIPQFQPGAKVNLMIDPQDPQKVVVAGILA